MARLSDMIETAQRRGSKATLSVARVDSDIKMLSKKYNVPIYRGEDADKSTSSVYFYQMIWWKVLKECSNPVCAAVELVSPLKCCGACKNALYCSRLCQSIHWKSGHKQECKK